MLPSETTGNTKPLLEGKGELGRRHAQYSTSHAALLPPCLPCLSRSPRGAQVATARGGNARTREGDDGPRTRSGETVCGAQPV